MYVTSNPLFILHGQTQKNSNKYTLKNVVLLVKA